MMLYHVYHGKRIRTKQAQKTMADNKTESTISHLEKAKENATLQQGTECLRQQKDQHHQQCRRKQTVAFYTGGCK